MDHREGLLLIDSLFVALLGVSCFCKLLAPSNGLWGARLRVTFDEQHWLRENSLSDKLGE